MIDRGVAGVGETRDVPVQGAQVTHMEHAIQARHADAVGVDLFVPRTVALSLRRSSLEMMARSRTGFTSPSTCVMSSSVKARVTWKMASQAAMLDRNALPRP
jgi:hypothetical protein